MVELNIGGERAVKVARSTLTQVEDSMLAAMFSGRHKLDTDDMGAFVLDRDPKYFSYILDYLRNGGQLPANMPEDAHELRRVQEEFDYFLLTPPPPPSLAAIYAQGAYAQHTLHSAVDDSERRTVREVALSDRYLAVVHEAGERGAYSFRRPAVEVWDFAQDSGHFFLDLDSGFADDPRGMSIHGHLLAAVCSGICITVWDLERSGEVVQRIEVSYNGYEAPFGHMSKTRLTGEYLAVNPSRISQGILVWDTKTWERMPMLPVPWCPFGFGFCGTELYHLHDKKVKMTNMLTGETETAHWANKTAVPYDYIDMCGSMLACTAGMLRRSLSEADGQSAPPPCIDVYDVNTRALVKTLELRGIQLRQHLYAHTEDTLVLACDDVTRLMDVKTGEMVTVEESGWRHARVVASGTRIVRVIRDWAADTPKHVILYDCS